MNHTVIYDLDPVPASRPRVTKRGTFYLPKYAKWKEAAAWLIVKQAPPAPFTGPVAVTVESVFKRPAKASNAYPTGDVDNLAKGPMDALTKDPGKRFWVDDTQVVSLLSTKRYAKKGEKPHVKLTITTVDVD